MSANNLLTAYIIETGESDFAVSIDVSGHKIVGDEPVDAGGKNLGAAPYDLLTAALGECTAMTVRWYALQQKWPLDKVEVKITHQKIDKSSLFEKRNYYPWRQTDRGTTPNAHQRRCQMPRTKDTRRED
jgi:uncharacterized OsmC-like protein